MENNNERLRQLKNELDSTYSEMKQILIKNNIERKYVARLPDLEHKKWLDLNTRSTALINEFILLIGGGI